MVRPTLYPFGCLLLLHLTTKLLIRGQAPFFPLATRSCLQTIIHKISSLLAAAYKAWMIISFAAIFSFDQIDDFCRRPLISEQRELFPFFWSKPPKRSTGKCRTKLRWFFSASFTTGLISKDCFSRVYRLRCHSRQTERRPNGRSKSQSGTSPFAFLTSCSCL